MQSGECLARCYTDGTWLRVTWSGGRFVSLEPVEAGSTDEEWIAPAIFDPQVNGYAGVDFQSDDTSAVQLIHAASELRLSGCTRFLFTLITDTWPRLLARLRRVKEIRDASPALSHSIAGWHIEGPFLSAEPGYHGAHDPACMMDPSPQHLGALRAAAGSDPLLMTLAPERPGSLESIRVARELGIIVSLGHTNASAPRLQEARVAGAAAFTHLGNACPRELDRHDNIVWRVLDTRGLAVSLIPDAIHVSPSLFRIIHRVLDQARILYTTDAMSAAGAPPGTYRLGSMELEVGADEVVRQPGKNNFAGSALKPVEGVRRAVRMLGCPWRDLWSGFSTRPAALVGIAHELAPGRLADFCLLRTTPEGNLSRVRTFCAGQECE